VSTRHKKQQPAAEQLLLFGARDLASSFGAPSSLPTPLCVVPIAAADISCATAVGSPPSDALGIEIVDHLSAAGKHDDASGSAEDTGLAVVLPVSARRTLRANDDHPVDHVCSADDFVVGPAARFDANLGAIALLKALGSATRRPSAEERSTLARFSGFGDSAFEPAFRLAGHRAQEQPWVERGQRLRDLVDEDEWRWLERSHLNSFFTSADIISGVWEGLSTMGLSAIPEPCVLEPAAGIGRFLGMQPLEVALRSHRAAVELDLITARLLTLLYPRAAVHSSAFEDAPLRESFFDVAISNVAFGDYPVVDTNYLKPAQRVLTRSIHN
jgi:hypothetical protein